MGVIERNELIYSIVKKCQDMIDTIDDLEEYGIHNNGVKFTAMAFKSECEKFVGDNFKNNPKLVDIYSRDILLKNKIDGMSLAGRMAIDSVIDSINKSEQSK